MQLKIDKPMAYGLILLPSSSLTQSINSQLNYDYENQADFRKMVETSAEWICARPILLLLNQSNN